MSDENKKYVPEGVFLVCDQGAVPTQLVCDPHPIELYDVRYADENDHKPLLNIPSFGVCKVSPSGTCLPPILRWTKVKEDFLMHGFHPLLEDSECVCTAGGIVKIYFDEYEASVAQANAGASDFVKEPISNYILGMIGGFPFSMLSADLRDGVGSGLKSGLESSWNFLTQAVTHPLDTLGGIGKMAVIAAVYGANSSNPLGSLQSDTQLRVLDAKFGTDFTETSHALFEGLDKAGTKAAEDVKRGNLNEIGKDVGQVEYAVIEAIVGSKGAGLAVKGAKTAVETAVGAERLAEISQRAAQTLEKIKFGAKGVVKTGAKLPEKYLTTELGKAFVGEELGEGWMRGWGKKVKYLTDAERDAHELFIKNGKIYDVNGNLYDTTKSKTFWSGNGKSIFVMDENGRIFASEFQEPRYFHHSSLSQGKPVSGAGEIKVENGRVTEITNQSGHYRPENNNQVLDKLSKEGVDTKKIKINDIK